MNILLVEDDPVIADAICVYLGNAIMQVTHASTLSEAKHYVTTCAFDICLLDIALPDGSGLELIKVVKKKNLALPIVLLTAKDAIEDKVKALNDGADDYITKPFDFEELMARINSVYRRFTHQQNSYLQHGELKYDAKSKLATIGNKRLALSASELKLLVAFLSNPNRILDESQLKDCLYGINEDVSSNALNVHLFNLRKKVGKNIIVTERGLGFRLASLEESK
ncbi:response regulator transcription factor [Alteromonas sp. ASW11-130]|uniref:response regulator transcription factor n=1 Tax=Alteromonas sp. ASW11-130 TaxID=3015775 RepID=UPI0022422C93|nr:response regulator transcription factor [Alteromonas sp. ASW11-130]MCW8092712.1 response regulator transcription factor [Alteromonas sp. ASW11-130]